MFLNDLVHFETILRKKILVQFFFQSLCGEYKGYLMCFFVPKKFLCTLYVPSMAENHFYTVFFTGNLFLDGLDPFLAIKNAKISCT